MKNFFSSILFAILSLFLFNCAGGGGGGGGGGSSSVTTCTTSTSSYCTDELNEQYGLVTTKAYVAYDRGYTGNGIKVAVLDAEFDTSHSDLDANIITGYDEEDDDNSVAHVGSYSSAHGTHVAGIIAAEKNNSGMHGVAYNASIMPVKIFADSGSAMSDISNSVAYAVDNGAIALNNSWGTSTFTSAASCTINGYVNQTCYGYIPGTSSSGFNGTAERTEWDDVATSNAVAVFAAGNNGNNSETGKINFYASTSTSSTFIGSYTPQVVKNAGLISYTNRSTYEGRFGLIDSDIQENWLNVVAVNSSNEIASFSNGCGDTKAYCIAAPGVDIKSTVPTSINSSGFTTKSGTSMAAPHVSAAVAILKQEFPNLTGAQIVDLLLNSATDLGSSGTDEVYGVGLLNLDGATQASGKMSIAMTNDTNDLDKLGLDESRLKFSKFFNKGSIKPSNFVGVVDSYDRVYSYKLKDFVNYSKEPKNNFDNIFNKNKKNNEIEVEMDKFNFVNYISIDKNSLENFSSFTFKNQTNPFYDLVSKGSQNLNFYNNLLDMNLVISNDQNKKNLDFAISTNLNVFENHPFAIGLINEEEKFLNSYGSGFFENKSNTKTIYLDYEKKYELQNFNLTTDFSVGETLLKFKNSDYLDDASITTSSYRIALDSKIDKNKIKYSFGYYQPLGINNGELKLKTISGYSSSGDYMNRTQIIDLKNTENRVFLDMYKFSDKNSVLNFTADTDGNDTDLTIVYEIKY